MIHSLSENIADFLLSNNCFEKENIDIYVYGIELVVSTLLGIVIVMLLSIAFNCVFDGLLFYMAFYTLRKFTGGLHCNTHLKCNLTYISIFLISVIINSLIKGTSLRIIVLGVFIVFSFVTIFLFAPIENINKPIKKENMLKFKLISISVFLLHIFLFSVISYFSDNRADMIIITDLFVALLIIISLFLNKERRVKNENI